MRIQVWVSLTNLKNNNRIIIGNNCYWRCFKFVEFGPLWGWLCVFKYNCFLCMSEFCGKLRYGKCFHMKKSIVNSFYPMGIKTKRDFM